MTLSIIIPTLNEEVCIKRLLTHLFRTFDIISYELIIVDAGSTDNTIGVIESFGIIPITTLKKSRAHQMNIGAQKAKGEVLYFMHADVLPHEDCIQEIKKAIAEGYPSGCFSYQFESNHPLLKINAYFTRFESSLCGGGDQTLFITKDQFKKMGGFNEDFVIMEDFELSGRLRKSKLFKVIPKDIIVSARKYEKNNYLRVQLANFIVFTMYRFGISPPKLASTYSRLLN